MLVHKLDSRDDTYSRNSSSSSNSDTVDSIDTISTADLDVTSRKVVMDITKQLYKNLDLQRICLPTFFLEPRSMLERITDSLSHPDILLRASKEQDPLQRFIEVTRYFLSGWHSSPKGVKKPYNPVLGEVFKCKYEYDYNDTRSEAFFIAEQVSHHPPVSAFYYESPKNGIQIKGDVKPKTRFLGTCVGNSMEGENRIIFTHFDNEEYVINMPSVYIYGVLYGNMYLDLGDKCSITCKSTGYVCDFKFSSKGIFSGGRYNSVSGKIRKETNETALYEIEGQWSNKIYINEPHSEEKVLFFDARTAMIHPKVVEPIEQQSPTESRRLWSKVTDAILDQDLDRATEEKTIIENRQRADAKKRKTEGNHKENYIGKYFILGSHNRYNFIGGSDHVTEGEEKTKPKLIETLFPASTNYPTKEEAY